MKIVLSTVLVVSILVTGGMPPPASYAWFLERYVDEEGLVDYSGMKSWARLDVLRLFGDRDPASYDSWDDNDRIAFLLNAYNANVLSLVLDHYPLKPSTGKEKFPANSIRQIPGAWEHQKLRVLGREVTLDEIEHKILRAEFKEPRIHMALVNSAMSAPKLRREEYAGEKLDTQLDDQARQFFSDLRKFHIDREAGEVWVSPIFNWFTDDFLPDATKNYPRHIAQQKSLTAFASKYVSAEDAKYLQEGKYVVMYFEYDWTLNEQAK